MSSEDSDDFETWGEQLYTDVVISASSLMLVFYGMTLFKALQGTSYAFVIILIILFMISNIGSIGAGYYNHRAGVIVGD